MNELARDKKTGIVYKAETSPFKIDGKKIVIIENEEGLLAVEQKDYDIMNDEDLLDILSQEANKAKKTLEANTSIDEDLAVHQELHNLIASFDSFGELLKKRAASKDNYDLLVRSRVIMENIIQVMNQHNAVLSAMLLDGEGDPDVRFS